MRPTVGRIVLWAREAWDAFEGMPPEFPAIVTQVFLGDVVHLIAFSPMGTHIRLSVPASTDEREPQRGTWRWPPRVQ